MVDRTKKQQIRSFSGRLRLVSSRITEPLGQWLWHMGIHPDMLTLLGLLLVSISSILIGTGHFIIGAMILIVALPFDVLDGAVARAMEGDNQFGAMLDSTLDRYADGFIFVALSYYFAVHNQPTILLGAQAALIGSLLVSYTRARAEGLGVDCKVGLFTRFERTAIIIIMLLFPIGLTWGIVILAIGTNITALQRLWYVYYALNNKGN